MFPETFLVFKIHRDVIHFYLANIMVTRIRTSK